MDKILGQCSRCGGAVLQRHLVTSEGPTVTKPQCCNCGATAKAQNKIIEMDESTFPQLLLD